MSVVQYKCANCGANLEFRAEKKDFNCNYCDSVFTAEQLREIYPDDILDKVEPEEKTENISEEEYQKFAEYNALYNCPSCGAAVITDTTTSATKCFYCHSPVILAGRLSGEYRPSKLIPFKVTREAASEMLSHYCKKRLFLPKDFKTESNLSELSGIYIPYWIADCKAGGTLRAKCTTVRTWVSGNYQYTETSEYVAVRRGNMDFNGIPHDASKKADDTLMENLEPFNYSDTIDFDMPYLSGYLAEKYDVTKEEVAPKIKNRAVTSARSQMKATIKGYSTVYVTEDTLDTESLSFKQYLMPIWFLSYKYKDKDYHFAINGQTGKFTGNLPIVWGKVIGLCGIIAAIITTITSIGGMYL